MQHGLKMWTFCERLHKSCMCLVWKIPERFYCGVPGSNRLPIFCTVRIPRALELGDVGYPYSTLSAALIICKSMGRSPGWSFPASPCLIYEDTVGSRPKCIVRTQPMESNMSEMETNWARLVTHCLVTALFSSIPFHQPWEAQ